MEIVRYDKGGPHTGLFRDIGVVNFEVREEGSGMEFCLGFRFKGGNSRDPSNYEYDHANDFSNGDARIVLGEELDKVMKRNKTSLGELLKSYLTIF